MYKEAQALQAVFDACKDDDYTPYEQLMEGGYKAQLLEDKRLIENGKV
jgi:hypothetical protein